MKKLLFALALISTSSIAQVNLNQGLIAYYPFNGNANDATGNGFNGVVNNGVQLTTDRFGNANSAYLFDGYDDQIIVTDNGGLSPASLSIVCYFNAEIIAQQMIIGKINAANGNGATYNLGVYNNSGSTASFSVYHELSECFGPVPSTLQYSLSAPYSPSINAWHCAIGTFSNGVLKFYIDGVLMSTDIYSFENAKNCNNTNLIIGSWWNGNGIPFKGKIDDVRIYNRAINQDEVNALCPSGAPLPVTLTSFTTKIINKNKIQINWDTEEELNISNYTLQRSTSSTEGFVSIATIESNSNNIRNAYNFTDANVRANINYYYRLLIKEKSGAGKYSAIRNEIIIDKSFLVNLFPNPSHDNISLLVENFNGIADITIYNNLGQIVFAKKDFINNSSVINLDLKTQPTGNYTVRVIAGENIVSKKIIKL